MVLKATIGDVALPAWFTLGGAFAYCARINVTAADAITRPPIFTYEADVAGLAFVNPDYSDRRVLYYNGSTFEEIDSDVRDIGMGLRVYFAAQKNLGAGASDTTSYWLFWNSTTAVATKTNRDNIYMYWDDFESGIAPWTLDGAWTNPAGTLRGNSADAYAYRTDWNIGDFICYVRMRAVVDWGGPILRSTNPPVDAGDYYALLADNLTDRCYQGRRMGGAWVGTGWLVPYVGFDAATWSIYKYKAVGNVQDGWVDTIPFATQGYVNFANGIFGLRTRELGAPDIYFDDVYILHAVLNEPVVALGATEDVSDLMPKNIVADFQEPRKMVAAITAIEGITGVLGE